MLFLMGGKLQIEWDREHRGSGITLLGITSLFMHKLTGLEGKKNALFT